MHRVVIVGGGFGGLAVAQGLAGTHAQVRLIDRRNHHLFQPLLYQVATAALAPSDIAEPLRGILDRAPNVEVQLGEVTGVDLVGRAVLVGEERVPYDTLVVAAGMKTTWFGHDDWAPLAPGLKTLGDALALRHRILGAFERAEWEPDSAKRRALLTFVVVGAGPTGVELAGALREIAVEAMAEDFRHIAPRLARVMLVEAGPDVLATFEAPLRHKAREALERLGVEVRTGTRVERIAEDEIVIDGESVRASVVLWAAGVAAEPIGADLGAPRDRAGRVSVGSDCALVDHPEVFVIGDMARFEAGRDAPLPGVAPVAIQQGKFVARQILRTIAQKPRETFRYRDWGSMATIGRRLAVVQFRRLRLAGMVAWLAWVFVHLMTLVSHRSRFVVFVKWAWAWLTWERSSRLIWR
jgi:NADH dehydrogenase